MNNCPPHSHTEDSLNNQPGSEISNCDSLNINSQQPNEVNLVHGQKLCDPDLRAADESSFS